MDPEEIERFVRNVLAGVQARAGYAVPAAALDAATEQIVDRWVTDAGALIVSPVESGMMSS